MANITFFYPSEIRPVVEQPIDAEPDTPEKMNAALTSNPLSLTTIYKERKNIARSIQFYGNRLANIDYVSFKFLNAHQRQALEEELLNTASLLYDECQLHLFEKELPLLRERGKQLELCAKLLYRLRNTPELGEHNAPDQAHRAEMDTSLDQPVKYVALTVIAPLIAETMKQITTGERLEFTRDTMTDANMYRLNWVWGGGLDQALLSAIPTDWGHTQHAQNILDTIRPVTGYMSFVLYYLRLGIRLYLLTKGTIKGSWMDPWATDAERAVDLSIRERFEYQCEKHGFDIINDFFWATANMACFLWLVNDGMWGCTAYVGNAVTALLLLMDLYLTHCKYIHKAAEHRAVVEQYGIDLDDLEEQINQEPNDFRKNVLKEHRKGLIEAKETCELEWKAAYKNFYYDLVYAASLLAAFALLCCFFFPPAAIVPATALILGVVGAALSFTLTIAHNAMATNTEIEELQSFMGKTNNKRQALQTQLDTEQDPNQHAKLTLDIENLDKKITYQQAMIDYYKTKIIQQIFSEAMVPATAFVFLVFLPLNIGLPFMIPIIALLLLSSTILDYAYKPDDLKLSNVDGAPNPMNPA